MKLKKNTLLLLCGMLSLLATSAYARRIGVCGVNNYGQFGNGTTSTTANYTSLAFVGTDTTWVALSCGYYFNLALKGDGTLWAWGSNANGQLGDGTTTDQLIPVKIGTDNNWKAISAGAYFSLAIKTDGTLWAWGLNDKGQLGNGTTTNQTTPVQIGTETNWVQVSGGFDHCVAIKSNGTLWAWGNNAGYQLADGSTVNKTTPIQIGIETNWKSAYAGNGQSFFIKNDDTGWFSSAAGIVNVTATETTPLTNVSSFDNKNLYNVVLNNGTIYYRQDGQYFQTGIKKCQPLSYIRTDLSIVEAASIINVNTSSGIPGLSIAKAASIIDVITSSNIQCPQGHYTFTINSSYQFGCFTQQNINGTYRFIDVNNKWERVSSGYQHVLVLEKEDPKINPTITWNKPSDIAYGTALSEIQLNATTDVPGTFTYTPALGTVLSTGSHDIVVEFTPTFPNTFNTVKDTVNINVSVATDINKVDNSTLSISPNPVKENLQINGLKENATITIVDITGKIILNKSKFKNSSLNVSKLPSGMYIAQIQEGNTTSKLKFSKE